ASPGLSYLKWEHPVRPGDQLHVEAKVLEVRRSESKPDLGILRWRWEMKNQNEVTVLDLEAISLFKVPTA
ncbi:MAG: acyl dehydratase, partial [Arenicellales bacterium]